MLHPLRDQVANPVSTDIELVHAHGYAERLQIRLDLARQLDGRAPRNPVIRRMDEEHRRRIFAKYERRLFLPPVPRRAAHHEIRAAALTLDGVVRVRSATVEIRRQVHRQVGPGGVAHDTNAVWIDAPIPGTMAHQPHGAFRIQQRQALNSRVVELVGRAGTVLETDHCHALGIEDLRRVDHVRFPAEPPVATTRTNNDGHAVALIFRRQIRGDGGRRDHPNARVLIHAFNGSVLQELRWLARPKRNRIRRAFAQKLLQGTLTRGKLRSDSKVAKRPEHEDKQP